jgi:hypothetical protein
MAHEVKKGYREVQIACMMYCVRDKSARVWASEKKRVRVEEKYLVCLSRELYRVSNVRTSSYCNQTLRMAVQTRSSIMGSILMSFWSSLHKSDVPM